MTRDECLRQGGLVLDIFRRHELEAILDRSQPIEAERWAKRAWLLLMLALWETNADRLRHP
jgi:hypothetical protein